MSRRRRRESSSDMLHSDYRPTVSPKPIKAPPKSVRRMHAPISHAYAAKVKEARRVSKIYPIRKTEKYAGGLSAEDFIRSNFNSPWQTVLARTVPQKKSSRYARLARKGRK